ncbi:putative transposase of IS4/5 family DUF4096 [Streptomyces sp. 2132.2]|nr:putative transposase of IS4/5 family DUF4096 [Streptomyces sp. 2132.2]
MNLGLRITVHGAGRSHGRAVGGAGTAVADGCQGGATTNRGSAPADRRRRRRRRFRVRTGVPWRNIPVEYGPWHRIHDLFCRWQRNGTCQRILTRLKSSADANPFRRTSACPASDRAGHASAPTACGPTRRTPPAETAPTCARGIRCTIPDKADQARNRQKLGFRRRPTAVFRPGRLPRAPRGRVRDQPTQATPRRRHPVRRARRPLRGTANSPPSRGATQEIQERCRGRTGTRRRFSKPAVAAEGTVEGAR